MNPGAASPLLTLAWAVGLYAILFVGSAYSAGLPRCTVGANAPDGLALYLYHDLEPQRTTQQGTSGSELEYRAGRTSYFSLSVVRERAPDVPPIKAGMLPEQTGPTIPAQLRIFTLGPRSERILLCHTPVNAALGPSSTLRVDSDSPGQHLIVRYEVRAPLPVDTSLVVRASSTLQEAAELFPLRCRDINPAQLHAAFDLKSIKKTALAVPSCRQRVVVRSPQALLVTLHGAGKMLAGFKPPNSYANYTTLCEAAVHASAVTNFLVGVDPSLPVRRDGRDHLWALDVETYCKQRGSMTIEVREVIPKTKIAQRESVAPVAPAYGTPAFLTDLRLSCFSDLQFLPFVEARRRNKGEAVPERPFLDLTVLRRSGGTLSDAERAHVETASLYALSAWNRACLMCGQRTLSLASVNNRFYASSLLIEELHGTRPPGEAQSVGGFNLANRLANSLNNRVSAYLPMTSADLGRLCSSPLLKTILGATASCTMGMPHVHESSAELRVLLTDGFTACDSDPNTIACEQYGRQIELNARDYAYSVGPVAEIAFGRGKRVVPLDLIIAHEIGHWLGIDHVNSSGALMSATAEDARCIGNADVNALEERNRSGGPGLPVTNKFRYR